MADLGQKGSEEPVHTDPDITVRIPTPADVKGSA